MGCNCGGKGKFAAYQGREMVRVKIKNPNPKINYTKVIGKVSKTDYGWRFNNAEICILKVDYTATDFILVTDGKC